MNHIIYHILQKLDLFDHLKIFKDKFFKNKNERNNEKNRIDFYSQLISENSLCFDIGANYGNRSEAFLKLGAKVVAVEPQPKPLKFLKRKFNRKIIIVDKAVGSKPGKSYLYISSASALTSLSEEWIYKVKNGRFKHENWDNKIEVKVTTLDSLISKYGRPDFCKIDVEGFEFEVLKGLTQPIKTISFEFTIPEFIEKAIECVNYLKQFGEIECNYSPGESLIFALEKWLSPEDFINIFKNLASQGIVDGDIYVKFVFAK